ncbi:MAG: hypothetical protein KKE16_06210 [Firmicutes bacterium]|nr:hypothetical protein [Bacillota bacterium]
MRNRLLLWFVVSITIFVGLLFFIFNLGYLYNLSGDYITLIEYDTRLAANTILSVFFVLVVYVLLLIIKARNEEILKKSIIRFLPTLPLYPIFIGLFWFLLDVFATGDRAHYFELGTKFITANVDGYPNSMTIAQIENIGEHLKFGIGSYLLLLLFILLLINQLVLVMKYTKIFITK